MTSPRKTARIAEGLYLLSSTAAGVTLLYIPGHVVAAGNAAAIAANMLACERFFRALMVREPAAVVVFIFLVQSLQRPLAGGNTEKPR